MVIWSGFLAPTRAFSKGPPPIFRKHMPWGIGTESLGMIECIFAENGPLESGIESSFSGTCCGVKGDFRWIFGPNPWIFEGGPHHFPKTNALGYGHRKFGSDRMCIFAENGPLECRIESSFWGTCWGAKGDFMRYSYLYPYIFESRTRTFFESTCPELYAQQSWEWSDAYSWRNDLWKVNFKRVCKKPAGVLMVFEVDFWPLGVHFRRGPPTILKKHMPCGIGTESLGMIGCIFAENGPFEGGIESSFSGTGRGAKGDFRWIFDPNPCIFERGPHHFPNAHALRYRHRKFGDGRMYIRGEWALRRWHWIKF